MLTQKEIFTATWEEKFPSQPPRGTPPGTSAFRYNKPTVRPNHNLGGSAAKHAEHLAAAARNASYRANSRGGAMHHMAASVAHHQASDKFHEAAEHYEKHGRQGPARYYQAMARHHNEMAGLHDAQMNEATG